MPCQPVLVAHGGCFVIQPVSNLKCGIGEATANLSRSLLDGFEVLKRTSSSLQAVVETVRQLEDAPQFNAGKGSVYTTDLTIEMDAGLMDGSTGRASGVSTVSTVKNPILLAREVMFRTSHAILCGTGAEKFAQKCQNIQMMDPSYFETSERFEQTVKILKDMGLNVPANRVNLRKSSDRCETTNSPGTVGAVALDSQGRLAAASSTGGLAGKLPGRLSDSCVPGAGFYADKKVAASGTGNGDYFLQRQTCLRVAQLVEREPNSTSLDLVCQSVLKEFMNDCSAGLVAVNYNGEIALPFNTTGMYRGYVKSDGHVHVFVD